MTTEIYLWPLKRVCEQYHLSERTIKRYFEEIRKAPRYKRAWVTSNDCGNTLYNVLVLHDYLHFRTELQDKVMSRLIPPYDPEEVVWQMGTGNPYNRWLEPVEQTPQVDKDMIRKLMKEILLEGIGA